MPLLPTLARTAATGVRAESNATGATSTEDERNGNREPGAWHSLDLLAWFDSGAGIRLHRKAGDSRITRADRGKRPGHGRNRSRMGGCRNANRYDRADHSSGRVRTARKEIVRQSDVAGDET